MIMLKKKKKKQRRGYFYNLLNSTTNFNKKIIRKNNDSDIKRFKIFLNIIWGVYSVFIIIYIKILISFIMEIRVIKLFSKRYYGLNI